MIERPNSHRFLIAVAAVLLGCVLAGRQSLAQPVAVPPPQSADASQHRSISGVFPHLTVYGVYSQDGAHRLSGHDECGIGAVVPWADRLWMVTYAPHRPRGSEHKLYSVDSDLNLTIHPESVGGTPAGRMLHAESKQLFIAHYAISETGDVRVIPIEKMPIRVTGITRHLTDPANRVYYIDMEGSIWEVDVHTLEPTQLYKKPVPGWHAKGAYVSQGRLVMSNNGERAAGNYNDLLVGGPPQSDEDRGVLAEYDGNEWRVIERRQYTEVSGPSGLAGGSDGNEPIWAIGWDRRSLRLKVLDDGQWHTFLLPKAAFCNDASHGWYTEWPRIRQVASDRWMMDMHGMFFDFPVGFRAADTAGLRPIGSHLRYIPDFTHWNGQLVLATDETSIQGNRLAGQPQSNLWFGSDEELKTWGPASGYGGPWINDAVTAGVPSDPFLIAGFDRRQVHLAVAAPESESQADPQAADTEASDSAVRFTVQVDRRGNGRWDDLTTISVPVGGYRQALLSTPRPAPARHPGGLSYSTPFDPSFLPPALGAAWVRFIPDRDCQATVVLHQTSVLFHDAADAGQLFAGLVEIDHAASAEPTLLYAAKHNRNLVVIGDDGRQFELGKADFQFQEVTPDEATAELLTIDQAEQSVDAASVILHHGDRRLRLPKGPAEFDSWVGRGSREVQSERHLANFHGTFYEVPLLENGQPPAYPLMRPVASHRYAISDFCSWNGLLVMAAARLDRPDDPHVISSDQHGVGLWVGGIDDLWKLGKPVGVGGPWLDSAVAAGGVSDPYLMTGYDRKTLSLQADRDTQIDIEVDFDHQSGWHRYRTVSLTAGRQQTIEFPDGFSAHWVRLRSSEAATVSAVFRYE